jgi:hypothetical protein
VVVAVEGGEVEGESVGSEAVRISKSKKN